MATTKGTTLDRADNMTIPATATSVAMALKMAMNRQFLARVMISP